MLTQHWQKEKKQAGSNLGVSHLHIKIVALLPQLLLCILASRTTIAAPSKIAEGDVGYHLDKTSHTRAP